MNRSFGALTLAILVTVAVTPAAANAGSVPVAGQAMVVMVNGPKPWTCANISAVTAGEPLFEATAVPARPLLMFQDTACQSAPSPLFGWGESSVGWRSFMMTQADTELVAYSWVRAEGELPGSHSTLRAVTDAGSSISIGNALMRQCLDLVAASGLGESFTELTVTVPSGKPGRFALLHPDSQCDGTADIVAIPADGLPLQVKQKFAAVTLID